jgi:hypothetical protein
MGKGDPEREEGEANSKIIAELIRACEELAFKKKKPWELEWIITEAKELAREWKIKEPGGRRPPLFDGTASAGTILLAALAVALRRDHELVERINRHFPNELEQLDFASSYAEYKPLADALGKMKWDRRLKKYQPLTEEQLYERSRNEVRRPGYGLIGEQFGSAGPLWLGVEPTCLDPIFHRGSVNMTRLVELFGVERHRLLKLLTVEKRRFSYLSIVEIMKELLRQRPIPPRQKRKRSKPGAPRRAPWLNDQDLRERVLDGIQERINTLSVPQHIKAAFEEVVRRYSGQSGKK